MLLLGGYAAFTLPFAAVKLGRRALGLPPARPIVVIIKFNYIWPAGWLALLAPPWTRQQGAMDARGV